MLEKATRKAAADAARKRLAKEELGPTLFPIAKGVRPANLVPRELSPTAALLYSSS